jgi:hypothetical protein
MILFTSLKNKKRGNLYEIIHMVEDVNYINAGLLRHLDFICVNDSDSVIRRIKLQGYYYLGKSDDIIFDANFDTVNNYVEMEYLKVKTIIDTALIKYNRMTQTTDILK